MENPPSGVCYTTRRIVGLFQIGPCAGAETMPRNSHQRSFFFRVFRFGFRFAALVALAVLACNAWVILSTLSRIYSDADAIDFRPVGLVLGTSKKVAPNVPNPHFDTRLEAAAALFKAGKVRHLLVSGHEEPQYYSEPRDMKERLLSLGVPANAITEDASGARTLDSVVRAKRIFGLDQLTIISDDFHVARALFLARSEGLDALAFTGKPVALHDSKRARGREYLARVKAVLDIYVLHTAPVLAEEPRKILVQGLSE